MKLSDFKYNLPDELIAQYPAEKREQAKLMVLDRKTETIETKVFSDIIDYLNPGDCLVLNNTKVAHAGANYFVTWYEYSPYQIYGARVSMAGEVLDKPAIAIATESGDSAWLAVASDGSTFLVAWTEGYNFYKDIDLLTKFISAHPALIHLKIPNRTMGISVSISSYTEMA